MALNTSILGAKGPAVLGEHVRNEVNELSAASNSSGALQSFRSLL